MKKKAALDVTETRLDKRREKMDREPLNKTTEQGLSDDERGKENEAPSLVEKKLSDKALPTDNSKLQGLPEKRLDTASTSPYPHRNPDAWERTGDQRPVNNLPAEMGENSDEKRAERFEKADKAAQDEPKRVLDKDVGKQMTNKRAFNLRVKELAKKYAGYEKYLNYKSGDGPYCPSRTKRLAKIDERLSEIMKQERVLNEEEQKEVTALKQEKSSLLGISKE